MSKTNYQLRTATINDAKILYAWSTRDDVRKNAINQEGFSYENHVMWLKKKLESPDCLFFIMVHNDESIGQIRIDREEKYWILDYSIDPVWRGKGLGTKAIELLFYKVKEIDIMAKVLETNAPSINVLRKLGFEKMNIEKIADRPFVVFVKHV